MVPSCAARIGDLRAGDFVQVQRGGCGHDGLIHPAVRCRRSSSGRTSGSLISRPGFGAVGTM